LHLPRESKQSLFCLAKQRKVWTSQERIPAKGWGPQGYGKCNRKYSATGPDKQAGVDRLKMRALGVRHTYRKVRCYKPYPKQECQVCSPQMLGARSLESFGDKAPRGMIAHDKIRLIAFPSFKSACSSLRNRHFLSFRNQI